MLDSNIARDGARARQVGDPRALALRLTLIVADEPITGLGGADHSYRCHHPQHLK
jgi:hypothetical protein